MSNARVVLVERLHSTSRSLLHELQSLAETIDCEVAATLTQVRPQAGKFQIGEGKVDELKALIAKFGATKIIFENELKPTQAYNLAKATGLEVVDKFQVVLEVFSKHASTKEARLQIKLARLKYELVRAREKVRLAKKGEQPGFHGLGRYEVEVYYEAIKRQVAHIEDELSRIREEKRLRRMSREKLGLLVISLAGYTSAGKSTLFNALTNSRVAVTGKPFTTLSTKTSAVDFSGKRGLLCDTVGFIDNLSIDLMEAFRSTLEETIFSTLIILVIDASEPLEEVERKTRCCIRTLREIGVVTPPIIAALNKIDMVEPAHLQRVGEIVRPFCTCEVSISALRQTNLGDLRSLIAHELRGFIKVSFELPLTSKSMSLMSRIREMGLVIDQKYSDKSLVVTLESQDYVMDKIKSHMENAGGKVLEAYRI